MLQNSLDVCLKHANTSVVLGAIQVFLHYTSGLAELRDDVFNRVKGVSGVLYIIFEVKTGVQKIKQKWSYYSRCQSRKKEFFFDVHRVGWN